jgi:hypothetical protein
MKELEDTLIREITRINEKSIENPLGMEDVNILVKLTAAYNNYMKSPIDDQVDDLGGLSTEELLELARAELPDGD